MQKLEQDNKEYYTVIENKQGDKTVVYENKRVFKPSEKTLNRIVSEIEDNPLELSRLLTESVYENIEILTPKDHPINNIIENSKIITDFLNKGLNTQIKTIEKPAYEILKDTAVVTEIKNITIEEQKMQNSTIAYFPTTSIISRYIAINPCNYGNGRDFSGNYSGNNNKPYTNNSTNQNPSIPFIGGCGCS